MKVLIKDSVGNFFCRQPEVGFNQKKDMAHVFTCINEEHAKIIVEKTQMFTSQIDLSYELLQEEYCDIAKEKNETKKSKTNNAYSSYENVESFEITV